MIYQMVVCTLVGTGQRKCWDRGEASLRRVVFEQRHRGGKGGSHLHILGESIPSKRTSQCKGPAVGGPGVFRNSEGAIMTEVE